MVCVVAAILLFGSEYFEGFVFGGCGEGKECEVFVFAVDDEFFEYGVVFVDLVFAFSFDFCVLSESTVLELWASSMMMAYFLVSSFSIYW